MKLSVGSLALGKRKTPGENLENYISKWPFFFFVLEHASGTDGGETK